jgi:alanine racemase
MEKILAAVEPHIFAVAIVNLNNLVSNYRKIKMELAAKSAIGAVVKANAYGFGAIPISKKLYAEGCRIFFVATIEEGIEARSVLNDDADIYVLSGIMKGSEPLALENKLTPVLNDVHQIELWMEYAKKVGKKLEAVVQVDTGICRNGISKSDVEKYHQKIMENLVLKFVLSHLACADIADHKKNAVQLDRFRAVLATFGNNVKASFAATNGIFLGEEYQFDIVRPGKSLYGFSIREDKIGSLDPVMDVFARIVQLQEISAGETIGYGATFVAERNMKAITVGIGYADGFMRKFSGFGHGFIGEKRVPIVGRISMDYIVLDVTDVDESHFNVGDWVALTKTPNDTLERWALEMDTLPHEVACRFGQRVRRIYVGE